MDQIKVLIKAACDKEALIKEVQSKYAKPGNKSSLERSISRIEERERIIEERLLKAYEDFAEKLLDEDEYLYLKGKMKDEKAEIEQKKEEMKNKLSEQKRGNLI